MVLRFSNAKIVPFSRPNWSKNSSLKAALTYVSMFQIIRVLAHTLLIFIILICVLTFFLFSVFRACCNHCFVLLRHTQFHLTVFSFVFVSCAVQFVQ